MKVSEVLRLAEKRLVFRDSPTTSGFLVYICPALELLGKDGVRAKKFLHSLGMGCGGTEFGEMLCRGSFSKEQMAQRHAWLLFAAELADEWGVE